MPVDRDTPAFQLDDINQQIIYGLMTAARSSSLPTIAETITPHGDTTLQPDDVVTLFSCGGVADVALRTFTGSSREEH